MIRATALTLILAIATPPASAASDDECAIWFCLPVSFAMSGCSDSKRAFIKRIFKREDPVPPMRECSVDGEDNGFEVRHGVGAVLNGNIETIVIGRRCIKAIHNGDPNQPRGCTGTVDITSLWQYGEPIGDTHVHHRSD